jgi:threonine/homoserine/homoserine lactone efflux protein
LRTEFRKMGESTSLSRAAQHVKLQQGFVFCFVFFLCWWCTTVLLVHKGASSAQRENFQKREQQKCLLLGLMGLEGSRFGMRMVGVAGRVA